MRRTLVVLAAVAAVACGAVTPVPAGTPLTIDQLKFRVMDAVGHPVYCDRDYYPIARQGGEQQNAIDQYPQIKANAELYAAIIAHEHLPSGDLTDDQKLDVYRAWKLLQALMLKPGGGYSFDYRVQKNSGSASYLEVVGTVAADGTVTVTSQHPTVPPMCPICLAGSTIIATPAGGVRVTDVKAGMIVWSTNAAGGRIAAPVREVGSMAVPAGHLMVHLRTADGRELLVSPGHRTADGRPLGTLATGDRLDGSTITTWELVPYRGERTYDLLPAGATGTYWANGILLSSTLAA